MSNTRKVAISLILLMIGGLGYLFYSKRRGEQQLDLREDGLGAKRAETRNYSFLVNDAPYNSANFTIGFYDYNTLATVTAKYQPWLDYSDPAFTATNRAANVKNAQWLKKYFDDIVTRVSKSLKLPKSLIYCVMLTETGSVASRAKFIKAEYDRLVSLNPSGAIGPMQVKPITATETVQIANNKGFISDYHREVLLDTIGVSRTQLLFTRESAKSKYYVDNKIIAYDGRREELLNDELNIMVAGMKIANLIDNYGERNLHQVFYAYNQGDRTVLVRGLTSKTNIYDFVNNSYGEGKKYVERIFGKHGALDIVINDLGIV